MTKAEVIDQMAQDAEISKTEAGAALNSFINNVNTVLKKKEKDSRAMVVPIYESPRFSMKLFPLISKINRGFLPSTQRPHHLVPLMLILGMLDLHTAF